MPYNSISDTYGIIKLNGTISQITLNDKIVNGNHPINIVFGELKTVPTIIGNKIEVPSTSSDLCIYNGNKYTLVEIQICISLHEGYKLPDMNDTPSAEMILTFSGTTEYAGILLCFPLYNTGVSDHDDYLNQIINQTDASTLVPLNSIFKQQPSLEYTTHFETVESVESNIININNLYILVFPKGIHLSDVNYQKLLMQTGALQPFTLHPVIRNGLPTISKSKIVDGIRKPINKSNIGKLQQVSISTCTDEFKKKFMFYPNPPIAATTATRTVTSESNYTTSQYKCVPFNNYTTYTKDDNTYVRIKTEDETLKEKMDKNPLVNIDNMNVDTTGIIIIAGGSIGFLCCVTLLYVGYKYLNTD